MSEAGGLPVVAIAGRPNVGKSTLFNRLVGRRMAIVDDRPGVTRDSIAEKVRMRNRVFHLVDTGGLTSYARKSGLEAQVEKQILRSLEGANAVLLVVDAAAGLVPDDAFVADILRRSGKAVLLVANKADGHTQEARAAEFFELGMGQALAVSALHGLGLDDMADALAEMLPEGGEPVAGARVNFCVVGRPNVGKSSLVNAILGQERCVVSSEPGTTRDSIAADFSWGGAGFTIVDTAGQKRRKKSLDDVEFYSIARAKESIRRSDVAALVLDAADGLLEGDKRIASTILEHKRGMLIIVNKTDLVPDGDTDAFIKYLLREAPFLRSAPVMFVSALMREGMDAVLDNIAEIHARMNTPLPLELLRNVIYDVRTLFSPRMRGRSAGEIKEVIHDKVNPPRIVLRVDDRDVFSPDYMRMMENRIREVFNLAGVPLEIVVHGSKKK